VAQILVVDDFAELAEVMSALFELHEHDLRIASDGHQAVEAARTFIPEIVFMDLDMPVLNGYDAARRIKAELPFKPYLVAVSAAANDGVEAATKEAGFDVCLRKPADADTLLALVDGVARRGD
jgi:CheY-like chemotaxis protein